MLKNQASHSLEMPSHSRALAEPGTPIVAAKEDFWVSFINNTSRAL
jgi:hypothetical protein